MEKAKCLKDSQLTAAILRERSKVLAQNLERIPGQAQAVELARECQCACAELANHLAVEIQAEETPAHAFPAGRWAQKQTTESEVGA